MALIKCKSCGEQVSDRTERCPYCGAPVVAETATVENKTTTSVPVAEPVKPFKSTSSTAKKALIIGGVSLLVIALLFGAWFVYKTFFGTSGADVIPDDALVVVELDLKELGSSAGNAVDGAEAKFEKAINKSKLDSESKQFLLDVIDNPLASGINVAKPLYLAICGTSEEDAMVSGVVSDEDDFDKLIEFLEDGGADLDVSETSKGIKYVAYRGLVLMYNSDYFIIKPYNQYAYVDGEIEEIDADDVVENAEELFDLDKSFADTPSFEHLEDVDGFLKMVITEEIYETEEFKRMMDAADVSISDEEKTSIVFALNAEPGKLTCTMDVAKASEQVEGLVNGIKGTYLPYVSENDILTAAINLNGSAIWKLVKDEVSSELLEQIEKEAGFDLAGYFKSINGDITFSVSNKLLENEMPQMALYAKTTNSDVVAFAAKVADFKELSSSVWEYPIYKYDYYDYPLYDGYDYDYKEPKKTKVGVMTMGYKDDASYFMTSKDQPTVFKKANSPIDKSLFVDKLMYARLNVQSILKMKLNGEKVGAEFKKECKGELGSNLGGAVYKSIENIDYIEMEVVNDGKTMNLSAVMIDQDKTPIEFVLNELMDIL